LYRSAAYRGLLKSMNYFAIQVKTGNESKFIRFAENLYPELRACLLFPQRKLPVRRKGKTVMTEKPIYPSYVFLYIKTIEPDLYWKLKRIPGYCRFLKRNQEKIEPLGGYDRKILEHFLSFGEKVGVSRVRFDENDKIRVLEGPLEGLEGQIEKVNKRKKRAKVRLTLYNNSFLIDFPFEDMENASKSDGADKDSGAKKKG